MPTHSIDRRTFLRRASCLAAALPWTHFGDSAAADRPEFVAYDFGHWCCQEGRYTYGRPVQVSVEQG
ncbi:MAG: hypothetical protein HY000_37185 [Planctomycetes bacterium]|nr:hypothetical protein [Planctomycetota bacterium]